MRKDGLSLQQIRLLLEFQKSLDTTLEAHAKTLPKGFQPIIVQQRLLIIAGDAQVCLGQHHFQHIHIGAEERPALHHLTQYWEPVVPGRLFKRHVTAQPTGQHQPHLGPGKYPRYGPKAFHAAGGLPPGRATSECQFPQGLFRRDLAEIGHEVGIFPDHIAVGFQGPLGKPVHGFTPAVFGLWWRGQGSFDNRRGVERQALNRQPRQTELEADHFALLGNPETAVYRARRLGQYRPVGRSAATANGTATAVEQGQMHAILAGNVGKFLLGLVLGPGCHQLAGILGGIRIADHHFLPALAILPIPLNLVQRRHAVWSTTQVIQGLKQGHDPHRKLHSGFPEQQNHAQYIRGLAGHGDNIGPEGFRRLLRHHFTGCQHLADRFGGLPSSGDQWAPALKFLHQECLALLF